MENRDAAQWGGAEESLSRPEAGGWGPRELWQAPPRSIVAKILGLTPIWPRLWRFGGDP